MSSHMNFVFRKPCISIDEKEQHLGLKYFHHLLPIPKLLKDNLEQGVGAIWALLFIFLCFNVHMISMVLILQKKNKNY